MDSFFGPQGRLSHSSDWVALIGAIGVMVIAGSIVADVLMRWLFNTPLLIVDDLNPFNIGIVIASFFPLCLVGKHLVTIRFLGRALGNRSHLWLEVLGGLFTLFIMTLYAWQFLRFSIDVSKTGLASGVLEVPQAPWWWSISILVVISVIVQVGVVILDFYRAVTGQMPEQEAIDDTSFEASV